MILSKWLALFGSRRFQAAASTVLGLILADVYGLDLDPETIFGVAVAVGALIIGQSSRPTPPKIQTAMAAQL